MKELVVKNECSSFRRLSLPPDCSLSLAVQCVARAKKTTRVLSGQWGGGTHSFDSRNRLLVVQCETCSSAVRNLPPGYLRR